MLNRMIAIGLTVIRQAVWIRIFTVFVVPRSNTRGQPVSCKSKANLFLQDLPPGRVLLAEIETKNKETYDND
jgi:hypothetical protein